MKIFPDKNYWKGDSLVIKASVQHNNELYSDTITIRKTYNIGYQVQISSSAGNLFSNGECSTILRAEVLLNGAVMGSGEVAQNIDFSWVRYELKSSQLDESWSANTQEIEITNLNLEDGYKYRCEISLKI